GATVRAIGPLDGDLVAFGAFTAVGGAPISGVARWSGGAWQAMTSVTAAAATLDEFGKVWVAGPGAAYGAPEVFTWTGSAWLGFGTSIGEIQAIAVANNQPVIGRDSYYGYGPNIARWNRAQWGAVGDVRPGSRRSRRRGARAQQRRRDRGRRVPVLRQHAALAHRALGRHRVAAVRPRPRRPGARARRTAGRRTAGRRRLRQRRHD